MPLNRTVFRGRVFKEPVKLKQGTEVAATAVRLVSYVVRRRLGRRQAQREEDLKTREKMPPTSHIGRQQKKSTLPTPRLQTQLLELQENTFLLFKSSSLILFFFFLIDCTCGMWRFLGWGLNSSCSSARSFNPLCHGGGLMNPCLRSDLSHCSQILNPRRHGCDTL